MTDQLGDSHSFNDLGALKTEREGERGWNGEDVNASLNCVLASAWRNTTKKLGAQLLVLGCG